MIILSGKNQEQEAKKVNIEIAADTEDKSHLIENGVLYADVSNFLSMTRYLLKNNEQYKEQFEMLGVTYKNFMKVWDDEDTGLVIDHALHEALIRLDEDNNKFVLTSEEEKQAIKAAQFDALPADDKKRIQEQKEMDEMIKTWEDSHGGSLDGFPY